MAQANIKDIIKDLEADLGIPDGFFRRLIDEDDWSFVIKAHAVMEAAVASLLMHTLGKPALAEIFALLEMSDTRVGKLAFAKALDALEQGDRRFIRELSQLRNTLVHNVRNTGLKLADYVPGLEEGRRRAFLEAVSYMHDDVVTIGEHKVPRLKFAYDNTKLVLWQSSMWLVATVFLQRQTAEQVHKTMNLVMEHWELTRGGQAKESGALGGFVLGESRLG